MPVLNKALKNRDGRGVNKNGKTEIPFFTLQEYEEWRQEVGEGLPGWHIKYYKGLGTSSSQVCVCVCACVYEREVPLLPNLP